MSARPGLIAKTAILSGPAARTRARRLKYFANYATGAMHPFQRLHASVLQTFAPLDVRLDTFTLGRTHGHTGPARRRPRRLHRARHGAGARVPGGRARLRVRVRAAGDAPRRRLDARAPERGPAPGGAGDQVLPVRLRAEP